MSRRGLIVLLAVLVLGAVGLVAGRFVGFAAAAPQSRPSVLRVDVAEWSVVPSTGVVPAGRVRIVVRNLGSVAHSLVVARTGSFGEELPLRGDHAVARPVGLPVAIGPGAVKSFVVQLTAGSYVLLDNLPWHYWKGTSVAIAVR
jgi:uncharacterized cupredoxin-like copper-binding protein